MEEKGGGACERCAFMNICEKLKKFKMKTILKFTRQKTYNKVNINKEFESDTHSIFLILISSHLDCVNL